MLPLPHISWSFSALVSFLISQRLYISYKKSKEENLGYFFKTFVLLGFFFSFISLPGLISNQPFLVQVSYILSWISLLPTPFLIYGILANVSGFQRFKKFLAPTAFLLIGFFLVLNILYFSPAKSQSFENYWYWSEGTPIWLQIFGGGFVGFLSLLAGIFFLARGFRSEERLIRIRSLLIGGGFIILFLGTLSGYILFLVSPILVLFSGFLCLIGIVIMYLGIRYKIEEQ